MKNVRAMIVVPMVAMLISPAFAQPVPERGGGFRGGRGQGQQFGRGFGPQGRRMRGRAMRGRHDERHQADHEVFQFLLRNYDKITRSVKRLPDGVETLTEAKDPKVAAKIKDHVKWMKYRVEETNPIRMRDPLFAELFRHADKIELVHEETESGVRVTETSTDPYVVTLIQAHADVVTGFVERGFDEAMKNHAVPRNDENLTRTKAHPTIVKQGGVVRLPGAAHQPRSGTKLLIDITRDSEPDQLNTALEKVAKYVNIYSGAGKEPADVQIAAVLHGGATLTALNPDAYASRFDAQENPNLELMHTLHEAGVEFFVCGQSLLSKGAELDELAVFVEPAVSALTAVANLQADGYVYVPLGN